MFRHFELSLSLFTLIDTSHYFLHKAHFNVMVKADKTVNISIALCWSWFKASTHSTIPLFIGGTIYAVRFIVRPVFSHHDVTPFVNYRAHLNNSNQ